jgi:dTDP-glucose 4,6-dehydratase
MRLLITGGCGFIGANFIHHLFEHDDSAVVVNLDKLTYAANPMSLRSLEEMHGDRYTFVRGDIADYPTTRRIMDEHDVEAVVNFAAESHVDRSIADPAPFVTTNVLGTQTLLQVSLEKQIEKFVHISTDEVYGSLGPEGRFTEKSPLAPNSPYAASKAAADLLVRAYHKTYGLPAVITRCSNNYGPYQFPEKLIPLAFKLAEADEPLPVYGDGLQVRDWIHVRDHCQGILLTLNKGTAGAIYNFGGNAERTNLDTIKALLKLMGKSETLIRFVKDRPGHDRRYAMDYSLAHKELGFSPSRTFEQGLAETIDWYKANGQWLEAVDSGAYREFMQQWYGERL